MEEDHTTGYYPIDERWFGPGPVRILPDVLCMSMHVFAAARSLLAKRPDRRIMLIVPLETNGSALAAFPESRVEVEKILDASPPSLLVSDENKPIFSEHQSLVGVTFLDTLKIFEGCLADMDGLSTVSLLFRERVRWSTEPEYQPYILVGEPRWMPTER